MADYLRNLRYASTHSPEEVAPQGRVAYMGRATREGVVSRLSFTGPDFSGLASGDAVNVLIEVPDFEWWMLRLFECRSILGGSMTAEIHVALYTWNPLAQFGGFGFDDAWQIFDPNASPPRVLLGLEPFQFRVDSWNQVTEAKVYEPTILNHGPTWRFDSELWQRQFHSGEVILARFEFVTVTATANTNVLPVFNVIRYPHRALLQERMRQRDGKLTIGTLLTEEIVAQPDQSQSLG